MQQSPAQLAKDVRAGKIAPFYYFLGDDDHRMREAVSFLAQTFLPQNSELSGVTRVDMNEKKFDDLRIELAEPPFFGEKKLVVALDPQRLTPAQQDKIIASLTPPLPERVVIFVTRASRKPKKTASFFKKMDVHAVVVTFGWLTQAEAASRIQRELGARETQISQQALSELFELTSGDSGRLVAECDKLASYAGAGGTVDVAEVLHVCAENPRRTVYELVDIVSAGNLSNALLTLNKLLTGGESPTGILFWLSNHYLNLYLIRSGRNLAPQMRWLAGRLKSQARSFTPEELADAIALCADCEAFMKGGHSSRLANSPREALEDVVRDLCLNRRPNAAKATARS